MPTESDTTQTLELKTTDQFLDGDCSEEKHLDELKKVMGNFRCVGYFLGFVLQLTTLGTVTWTELHWDQSPTFHQSVSVQVVHILLWVLSCAAFVIWLVVWMSAFFLCLTETGWRVVEPFFPTAPSDRELFLTGVNLFIGISTGSFLAMGLTDIIVGFPVGIFKLIAIYLVCLVLCKVMVVFYDRETIRLVQEEQEEEEQALIGIENGKSPYELLKPVVV